MAKRAAPDEKPYRPLLESEVLSAAFEAGAPAAVPASPQPSSVKILEMPRAEPVRRPEPAVAERLAPPLEKSVRSVSEPTTPTLASMVEKVDQGKKILFTRSESQAIDRLVVSLATRLNAQVKVSHVMRALVGLLLNAESQIDRRAGEVGPLVRPANGDAPALEKFERELGSIIAAAIRDAGPIR